MLPPKMSLTTYNTRVFLFGILVFSVLLTVFIHKQPRFATTPFRPPPPFNQASSNNLSHEGKHPKTSEKKTPTEDQASRSAARDNLAWCSSSSNNNSNINTTNNYYEQSTKVALAVEVRENHILKVLKEAGLSVQTGPGQPPMKTLPKTRFERCLLSSPPLDDDFQLAPNELKSKVTLVNPKPAYRTEDTVQFRADLYDGYGNPRRSGGDEVRMRVISIPGQQTSIAAEVKDLGNGSYLGTTLLPWKGTASVEVYVTYPREFLREAVRQRLTLLCSTWTSAVFKSGSGQEESTACLPSLPIPGYNTVCNLTDYNGGMTLFCGRPVKTKDLGCDHLSHFGRYTSIMAPDTAAAEQQLIRKIHRHESLHLIPNNISISVAAGERAQAASHPALPPCWKRPPRATWQSRAPRGWFDSGGVWTSLECSLPKVIHNRDVQRCFRNTSVYLVGDSNMRYWYYELRKHLICSKKQESVRRPHVHKLCEVSSSNTSLRWAFHARPTLTYPDSDNTPLPLVLADIRHHLLRQHPQRRVIVVLHYFLHLTLYSPSHYVDRLRAYRRHLQDFLQEFPEVIVVIRGPHIILSSSLLRGDVFGPFYVHAWHSVFRSLQDRVRFLDFWGMAIAAQNTEVHPPSWIQRETVKVFLGHVCEGLR